MKFVAFAAIFVVPLVVVGGMPAEEGRKVHGRVVDEHGEPVAGADVGWWWRANGSPNDKNGKPYDENFLKTDEGNKVFWGNVGKMEPWAKSAKTGPDGRFSLIVNEKFHGLMALDKGRECGGLAILPLGRGEADVEIRITRLVRVRGALRGPKDGRRPVWTHVYASLPEDLRRPLDMTALASCGCVGEGRFEMSLPPGRYVLYGYNDNDLEQDKLRGEFNREIRLSSDTPNVDFGTLQLVPKPSITDRKERAQAAGTWGDYTKHYGERPPSWSVVDARGVRKDVQVSDFKGKWLLVDFWGLSCATCLRDGLPKLMKFYEEHRAQHDRFEILAICIDEDGELKSIADVDKKLQPIVEHFWGKSLPFPVLLDPTFTTWERYGLPGMGTTILIDPDGKLVKGDETSLAEKLRER